MSVPSDVFAGLRPAGGGPPPRLPALLVNHGDCLRGIFTLTQRHLAFGDITVSTVAMLCFSTVTATESQTGIISNLNVAWTRVATWTRTLAESPQHLRSPMLTLAAKKLSTGANGQKEDAASFFCLRSFDRAVMAEATLARDSRPADWPSLRRDRIFFNSNRRALLPRPFGTKHAKS